MKKKREPTTILPQVIGHQKKERKEPASGRSGASSTENHE